VTNRSPDLETALGVNLLIYELVTGGGWRSGTADAPPASLLAEGRAMRDALVQDFAALPGVAVQVLHDERLPPLELPARQIPIRCAEEERAELERTASEGSPVVLIAPEVDGLLAERCRWVEAAGGKLLSPDSLFAALAGDKQATCERLASAGVPVPLGGCFVSAAEAKARRVAFPAVLKPADGAGSFAIRRVEGHRDIAPHCSRHPEVACWRIEQFCPGVAASISAFGGPRGWFLLPPGRQRLSDDGEFRYQGGELPLPPPLAARAESLGRRALTALPPTCGYVGLDLVLGPPADGRQDVVIEVNPRLTTSYVGLRRLCRANLAKVWLAWLDGEELPLDASDETVRFSPNGTATARLDA
jgi:predicted ATP-grasp superfamily ATP-dependent carboligase